MRWQQFFDLIKSGDTGGVFVFQGQEEYIKRSALEKLREKLLPPGLGALNETTLDGADAAHIIDSAETLPMMCERRLLIIQNWAPLLSGKAKDEADQAARMEAWLPKAPDSCAVVFYLREEMDKRKKASKAMEKFAKIVNFDYLADPELKKWVAGYLKPLGARMDPDAFEALIFVAGRALTRLTGELDKLAACALDGQITASDVRANVMPSAESNVFFMIDALMARDARKAYSILNAMLDAGENCVGLLAMITRQMRLLTHVKLLLNKKTPPAEIERKLGIMRFALQRLTQQALRADENTLIAGYQKSVACDFAVKSGKMRDRAALDEMMLFLQTIS